MLAVRAANPDDSLRVISNQAKKWEEPRQKSKIHASVSVS